MSENDGIQCPNCGTIATENTWYVNNGKCLSCGYVWLPEQEEQESAEQKEVTKSKIPWKVLGITFLCVFAGLLIMFGAEGLIDRQHNATTTPVAAISIEATATAVLTDTQFLIERPIDEIESDANPNEYLLHDIWSKGKTDIIIFMSIFLILLNVCGYLDSTRSHQVQDSTVAVITTIIMLVLGLRVFQTTIIQGMQIGLIILIYVLYFGGLIMLGSFTRAGTLDFTPVAMMLGSVAIAGGVFLNNLGGIQTLLKVASSPLFTLPSLFVLGKANQLWTYGAFSLLVYGHLILALFFAFIEIIKTGRGQKKNYRGFWFSILVVGLFVLIQSVVHPENIVITNTKLLWIKDVVTFLVAPGVLILVAIVANLLHASSMREKFDERVGNYTEYVIGNLRIVSPYDIILFQTLLATLMVMFIGKI